MIIRVTLVITIHAMKRSSQPTTFEVRFDQTNISLMQMTNTLRALAPDLANLGQLAAAVYTQVQAPPPQAPQPGTSGVCKGQSTINTSIKGKNVPQKGVKLPEPETEDSIEGEIQTVSDDSDGYATNDKWEGAIPLSAVYSDGEQPAKSAGDEKDKTNRSNRVRQVH